MKCSDNKEHFLVCKESLVKSYNLYLCRNSESESSTITAFQSPSTAVDFVPVDVHRHHLSCLSHLPGLVPCPHNAASAFPNPCSFSAVSEWQAKSEWYRIGQCQNEAQQGGVAAVFATCLQLSRFHPHILYIQLNWPGPSKERQRPWFTALYKCVYSLAPAHLHSLFSNMDFQ